MASRKPLKEKSKTFTTINIPMLVNMSICGNEEFENNWKYFFNKNKVNKGEFFIQNVMKDLNIKNKNDIFDDDDIKDYSKRILKVLLDNLNLSFHEKTKGKIRHNNFQDYWSFILKREMEKSES